MIYDYSVFSLGYGVQVFDFTGFMKPEYDTPIFCANFFTSANMNIVVL